MGIYVNPGNESFREAVNSMIYVDKTGLIAETNRVMNTSRKFMCVSRPRRFGKSMAADMLVAYYSRGCDSSPLFVGRNIAAADSYEEYLNCCNVIRFDVQRFLARREEIGSFIARIEHTICRELAEIYWKYAEEIVAAPLNDALEMIYAREGEGFIFIIDEWDSIFRMAQDRPDVQKAYLDFLRVLFKGAVYVDLVYMTGILPIKKYGEHSAVNMFDEYSMTDPKGLETFYGFTEEEVRRQCSMHNVSFDQMEEWYDGYLVGDYHIYNPKSVNDVLTWRKFKSYWTGTETYEALKIYIELDYDGLKASIVEMLGGGSCRIDPTTFQNDMTTFRSKDDVLTLLVHLGYLTYNESIEKVSIPNREIRQEFLRSVKTGTVWGDLIAALNRSADILESTWRQDGTAVAAGISDVRQEISSIIHFNDENALSYAVYTAYSAAQTYYLKPVREFPSGRGFIDLVYLPRRNVDRPALVIELKWEQSAEGAIRQIKDRNYTKWVREYTGEILLVGINYDKKDDRHECVIEKFQK